ncbi:arylesterase [Hongsoonwoonella zoysiae]|uniref:arylesterase n=1 Tax=Hongsoonwoonella zoysiae TaxID=2821844 RepID=UPI001FE2F43D|nr:arylesterase [Hongsoonwoonella zoysiae]
MIRSVTFFLGLALVFGALFSLEAKADTVKIVAFGDSLTAGYGLAATEAFPVQLEKALEEKGHSVEVVNAGVSGDTTTGGLARLDWSVPEDADAVILELGGNDALRGLPPETTLKNLDEMVARLKQRGIAVLVAGIRAPRNLGEEYAQAFDPVFADVAQKHGALLYPYFLEGIPLSPETVQGDGLHPTGKGVAIIVENILPKVEALIARARAS